MPAFTRPCARQSPPIPPPIIITLKSLFTAISCGRMQPARRALYLLGRRSRYRRRKIGNAENLPLVIFRKHVAFVFPKYVTSETCGLGRSVQPIRLTRVFERSKTPSAG